MGTISIGGLVWRDGEVSGDADQLALLGDFLGAWDGGKLPVFGNGPWVEPDVRDPKGFLAVAQPALGVNTWASEGIEWPAFWSNPSSQTDTIA